MDRRPRGTRNRATVAAETLLEEESAALARKAIDLALDGDTIALRLCLERLIPRRHERPIRFSLPELHNAADALLVLER